MATNRPDQREIDDALAFLANRAAQERARSWRAVAKARYPTLTLQPYTPHHATHACTPELCGRNIVILRGPDPGSDVAVLCTTSGVYHVHGKGHCPFRTHAPGSGIDVCALSGLVLELNTVTGGAEIVRDDNGIIIPGGHTHSAVRMYTAPEVMARDMLAAQSTGAAGATARARANEHAVRRRRRGLPRSDSAGTRHCASATRGNDTGECAEGYDAEQVDGDGDSNGDDDATEPYRDFHTLLPSDTAEGSSAATATAVALATTTTNAEDSAHNLAATAMRATVVVAGALPQNTAVHIVRDAWAAHDAHNDGDECGMRRRAVTQVCIACCGDFTLATHVAMAVMRTATASAAVARVTHGRPGMALVPVIEKAQRYAFGFIVWGLTDRARVVGNAHGIGGANRTSHCTLFDHLAAAATSEMLKHTEQQLPRVSKGRRRIVRTVLSEYSIVHRTLLHQLGVDLLRALYSGIRP